MRNFLFYCLYIFMLFSCKTEVVQETAANGGTAESDKPQLVVQNGHSSYATCLNISRDGSLLVSGSYDNTVVLWDLSQRRQIRQYLGHKDMINDVAVTPDNKYALSASADGTVQIWETGSGKCVLTFTGHGSAWVNAMALSPDGRFVLSAGGGSLIYWERQSGKELLRLPEKISETHCIVFSGDGKKAFTGGTGALICEWDLLGGKLARTFKSKNSLVNSIAVSPDEKTMLSAEGYAGGPGTIYRWDLPAGVITGEYKGHSDLVTSLSFSPDGSRFLSSGYDGNLFLWNTATGNREKEFVNLDQVYYAMVCSNDFTKAVAATSGRPLLVFDLVNGDFLGSLEGWNETVSHIRLSHDGRFCIFSSWDGSIRVWDLEAGRQAMVLTGHNLPVNEFDISPDDNYLVSCSGDTNMQIKAELLLWDLRTGKVLRSLAGHGTVINDVCFIDGGKKILSLGFEDELLKVWDTASGKLLKSMPVSLQANSLAVSPDEKQVALGLFKEVQVISLATGKTVWKAQGLNYVVRDVLFSPDGKYLVGCAGFKNENTDVGIFAAGTGTRVGSLRGHEDHVFSCDFSRDSTTIVTASWDGSVRFWSMLDFSCRSSFTVPNTYMYCVAFHPIYNYAVAGAIDGTVRFLKMADASLMASLICKALPLNEELPAFAWAVIGPDNLYETSPRGEEFLHFTTGIRIIPLKQLAGTYSRPRLLPAILSAQGFNR